MKKSILVRSVLIATAGLLLSGCGNKTEEKAVELTEHQKAWIADIDGEMRKALAASAGITENMTEE